MYLIHLWWENQVQKSFWMAIWLHVSKVLGFYSKGNNYQNPETTYRMEKNLFSYSLDKGLISRIYRALKIKHQKNRKYN
jgi:hypothetical protein